jgi:murein DD-endopeptidase MepM/ murein hydrolase activator NlpD
VARPGICFACGKAIDDGTRLVLVHGRTERVHCSEACLDDSVRKQEIAETRESRRWLVTVSLMTITALLPAAANLLLRRYRAPRPQVIVSGSPGEAPRAPPPQPIFFGPPWPPTEAEWLETFTKAIWTYPLPGPIRRPARIDDRVYGPEPPRNHPVVCRAKGRCGVDLGGDLWGEHVLAAQDGLVDHVRGGGVDERGGQYVRLSHFGGMVFTQYFHLAAIPRGLTRGVRVTAGDVIGLLGDTGVKGTRRHLHFSLSVRPSSDFSEEYWDPTTLMAKWPLRLPVYGTVAGFAPSRNEGEPPTRRRHAR